MILTVNNLTKYYGSFKALDNVSLNLEPGKIIGLLGPNGSGKTTLIKIINGLLSINSGSVQVCGYPVGIETKKIVSYLPERTYLNPDMQVKDCLDLFKDFYSDFEEEKAKSLLEKLNIGLNSRLKSLSKGTKEKVQLILVMSRKAKLYILDEPIAGVDPAARDLILNLIVNNLNPESTLLISTHLIQDIEEVLNEVIFINNGKIMLHDSVEEVKEKYNGSINNAFKEVFKCF